VTDNENVRGCSQRGCVSLPTHGAYNTRGEFMLLCTAHSRELMEVRKHIDRVNAAIDRLTQVLRTGAVRCVHSPTTVFGCIACSVDQMLKQHAETLVRLLQREFELNGDAT
jgi:hypothetical protein